MPDDEPTDEQVVVTLRGSMREIVTTLASAIAGGLVISIARVVPCTPEFYSNCPLAALLDPDHRSHTGELEMARERLVEARA